MKKISQQLQAEVFLECDILDEAIRNVCTKHLLKIGKVIGLDSVWNSFITI